MYVCYVFSSATHMQVCSLHPAGGVLLKFASIRIGVYYAQQDNKRQRQ